MSWLRQLIFLIGGTYIFLVILAYLFQSKLLFFPTDRKLAECQAARPLGFQVIETEYKNQNIRFLLKIDPLARANLIIFHGNASSACDSLSYYPEMKNLRLNFIMAAYPGYEGDNHKPTQNIFLENGDTIVVP